MLMACRLSLLRFFRDSWTVAIFHDRFYAFAAQLYSSVKEAPVCGRECLEKMEYVYGSYELQHLLTFHPSCPELHADHRPLISRGCYAGACCAYITGKAIAGL